MRKSSYHVVFHPDKARVGIGALLVPEWRFMMPGMSNEMPSQRSRTLPVVPVPQCVPSHVCLSCEICCRFPEPDSFLRPYFTREEIGRAIDKGLASSYFPDIEGSQIRVVSNPTGEGYLCPAFDPETFHCRIYEDRPFDCKIYPFAMMWNQDRTAVTLGWDRKCPFMVNDAARREDADTRLPEIQPFASAMHTLLESDQVIKQVMKHPQLITRYQEDVVMIGRLDRLTMRLTASP